jgi:hypothetical protein
VVAVIWWWGTLTSYSLVEALTTLCIVLSRVHLFYIQNRQKSQTLDFLGNTGNTAISLKISTQIEAAI